MDIKIKLALKLLLVIFFCIHLKAFCQHENIVQKKMVRFNVNCNLESELKKITENLKPEDSKLTFFINVIPEGEGYDISVSTSYDVDTSKSYVGFFYVHEKLFLISKNDSEIFFKVCGEEKISINVRKNKASKLIVEPYIDGLPSWLIRYKQGNFVTIYSSY